MEFFIMVLLITIIMAIAAFVKGIIGFGSSLIAIPLISAFVLAPGDTRAIVVTINLMLNLYLIIRADTLNLDGIKTFLPLIISVFIASLISGFFLTRFDSDAFNIVLGILLILTALNKLFKLSFIIPHPKRYFIPVGLLGGALNTLVGAGSVPVLIFLGNTDLKKDDFRTTIILFLLVLNIGSLGSFMINGAYDYTLLLIALGIMPVLLIASNLGIASKNKINDQIFQTIISLFLLFIGLNTIFGWL